MDLMVVSVLSFLFFPSPQVVKASVFFRFDFVHVASLFLAPIVLVKVGLAEWEFNPPWGFHSFFLFISSSCKLR